MVEHPSKGQVTGSSNAARMQAPRTEELFARIRRVCDGEESAEDVEPLIEATHFSMERARQEFLLHSSGDPEMSPGIRDKIAGALEQYLNTLLDLKDAAAADDLDALADGVEQAEQNVQNVRAAQDEHRAALATGATLFPFLNRVLIGLAAVNSGAEKERLVALLVEGASFFRSLRNELNRRGASPVKSQVVYHLQQSLEGLRTALADGTALPEIDEEVTTLASELAGLLAEPLLDSAESGATSLPAVNQVLQAVEALNSGSDALDFLLALLNQCSDYLRGLLPVTSPPDHVECLNELMDSLDALQQWAVEGADPQEKADVIADVVACASVLSEAVASSGDSTPYDEHVGTLPPVFKNPLLHGYLYLDGQGSADNVYSASDHLYSSAEQMTAQASQIPAGDPSREPVNEALDMIREAAEMLKGLAETANPAYLEAASGLCHEAAELLFPSNQRGR